MIVAPIREELGVIDIDAEFPGLGVVRRGGQDRKTEEEFQLIRRETLRRIVTGRNGPRMQVGIHGVRMVQGELGT